MTKQSVSARRAARTAKAEAKRKEIEEKRAARALAKVEKTKAETVAMETIDRLAGELKTLVDNAMSVMGSAMREAAERAYTLQQTYHLSQSEIGMKIGRSQPFVSGLLAWRLASYPDTPFGPQSKVKREKAKLLGAPNNPDPTVGLPKDGLKRTLLGDSDGTIVTERITGSVERPIEEVKAHDIKTVLPDDDKTEPLKDYSEPTVEAPPTQPEPEYVETEEERFDRELAEWKRDTAAKFNGWPKAEREKARTWLNSQRWGVAPLLKDGRKAA